MSDKTEKVSIEGKNLEDCLDRAARSLGVNRSDLEYEIVRGASNSLFSFFTGKRYEIQAWVRKTPQSASRHESRKGADRREQKSQKNTARERQVRSHRAEAPSDRTRQAEPLDDAQVKALASQLRDFWQGFCRTITGDEAAVAAAELTDDGRMVFNVESPELAEMYHRNGRFSEAVEHILRKVPRIRQELPFRIFVDFGGQRSDKEKEIVEMAKDLSNKVHEDQRPIVLGYRSAYERRIIHLTLDGDQRVYTKSIGAGSKRKLMILPRRPGDTPGEESENPT